MIDRFKKENIVYKAATIGLIAGMIYFLARIIVSVVLGVRYPSELLEPANVSLTRMFLDGKSPYTLNSLKYEYPAINCEYPFINSLISALIALVNGGNAVVAHYIVSFVALIGTGVLGYVIVKPLSKTTVAPVASALLFMMCHWRFGYVSAAPDSLGLFFFILSLYLAVSSKVKHKTIICAFMTAVCFYTKQYFILVALVIFIYMLCYSRKEAFKFLGYTLAVNILVAVIISIFWPLYWTYTFFFLYNGTFTGISFGIGSLVEQLKYLAAIFIGLFAVLLFAIISLIRKRKKEGKKLLGKVEIKPNNSVQLFAINIPVMLLPLIFFGRNDGAFLSYFLQLWMPSIIVVTFAFLEKFDGGKKQIIYDLFYLGVVAFTVLFAYLKMPLHILTQDEIDTWKYAYEIVDEYSKWGQVYYCQPLAYKGYEDNAKYMFCGHDGEVSDHTLEGWNNSPLSQKLFPHADEIINKTMGFRKFIIAKSFNEEIELLTFIDGNSLMYSEEFIEANIGYEKLEELTLQTGNMPYTVSFYVLKNPRHPK